MLLNPRGAGGKENVIAIGVRFHLWDREIAPSRAAGTQVDKELNLQRSWLVPLSPSQSLEANGHHVNLTQAPLLASPEQTPLEAAAHAIELPFSAGVAFWTFLSFPIDHKLPSGARLGEDRGKNLTA